MKSVSLLFLLLVSITFSQAQTGTILGTVTQADSFSIASGVNIHIEKTNFITNTNGNGNYSFKDVPVGSYTLVISTIGYQTLKREISIKQNETVRADFSITESLLKLNIL